MPKKEIEEKGIKLKVLKAEYEEFLDTENELIKEVCSVLPFSLIRNEKIETFVRRKYKDMRVLKPVARQCSVRSLEIIREIYTSENTERAF